MKVSRVKNIGANATPIDLEEVLDQIKTKNKDRILQIRQSVLDKNEEKKKELKKNLPGFTGGLFQPINYPGKTNRNLRDFISSQIVILDVDHVEDPHNLATTPPDKDPTEIALIKQDLEDWDEWITAHAYAAFRSPSGDGIKVIYVLQDQIKDPEEYRKVWMAIANRFEKYFQVQTDTATKDCTRLCFMSWDPNIYINEEAPEVDILELSDELDELDEVSRVSVQLKNDDQVDMFYDMADHIKIRHYKEFRDLCSAVSRIAVELGEDVLKEFYTRLYRHNKDRFSKETAKSLDLNNMSNYIRSFMKAHKRVPLQHVSNVAMLQGFAFEAYKPKGASANRSMYRLSDQKKEIIKYMNRNYACCQQGKAIAVLPTEHKVCSIMGNDSLSEANTGQVRLRNRADVKAFLENKRLFFINEKGDLASKSYWDIWWNHPIRRNVKAIICQPNARPKKSIINLWRGFNVHEGRAREIAAWEDENGERICQPVLDFIYEVICDENMTNYDFIINWLADLIQNPTAKKPGVAVVMRGLEGVGKNTFGKIVRDLVGPHASRELTDKKRLTGQFNTMLEGQLLVILNEAFFSKDQAVIEAIKALITDSNIEVEPKFAESYQTDFIGRFLIFSNHFHIVQVPSDDRRFVILDVSDKYKRDKQYFGKVYDCMENGGKESLYMFLKNIDYRFEDVNNVNVGSEQARYEQIRASFDPIDKFLSKAFTYGHFRYDYGDSAVRLNFTKLTYVKQSIIEKSFMFYCKENKVNYPSDISQIIRRLKKKCNITPRKGAAHEIDVTYQFPKINTIMKKNPEYQPPDWCEKDAEVDNII